MKEWHVLLLTTTGGFVPQFEMENVRILQEMGAVVHYAANFENPVYHVSKKELEEAGIRVHPVAIHKSPFRIGINWKAYRELIQLVEKENISCIHCHNPVGGVLGRILGRHFRKKNLKIIYTAHGFHFYKGAPLVNRIFYYPVEYLLARQTDALITINQEDYLAACRFRLKKQGKVYQIPGVGIRRERLKEIPGGGESVRKRYGIPERAFHIVSIGELNANKNHQIIINALKLLQNDEIYYTICGDGANREELQKLIVSLHLEQRVFLAGYQDEIAPFLQSADCFAFPSIREGLGMAALEAMAMGLPVVAAENRGTREYIEDGRNGYSCQWNSKEEFAKAIGYLYENQKERKQMGEHAKKTACRFDIEHTTEIMQKVYQSLWKEENGRNHDEK